MRALGKHHRIMSDNGCFLRRALVLGLCFLMSPATLCLGQSYPAPETVGAVIGVKPGATINNQPVDKAQPLLRNAVLRTDRSGRLRVRLRGGEVLSMGSSTELQVPRNNPVAETAKVNVVAGQLRSEVNHLRSREASYDVTTPQAGVTSHGDSDFYLDVSSARTRLIVYSGIVLIRPLHGASTASVDVAAGQTVVVTPGVVSRLELTAEDQEQDSMWQTSFPSDSLVQTSRPATHSHKKLYIILGAAGAAVGGIAVAMHGSSKPTTPASTTIPSSVPTIPA